MGKVFLQGLTQSSIEHQSYFDQNCWGKGARNPKNLQGVRLASKKST